MLVQKHFKLNQSANQILRKNNLAILLIKEEELLINQVGKYQIIKE